MKNIKLVETNQYFQEASKAAQAFEHQEEKLQGMKRKNASFSEKYKSIIASKARFKAAFILGTIGHLGAVLWEGSLIQPLCQEWLGGLVDPSLLLFVSLLPIFVLFSFSLAIGHSMHLISLEKHDLEHGRFRFNQLRQGVITLVLVVIYVSFLYYLMLIANEILQESLRINEFIIILGVVELVLSFLAICGWEILFVYFHRNTLKLQIRRSKKQMAGYARRCHNNNLYFYQRLDELEEKKRAIYLRMPHNDKVKRTVKFFHELKRKQTG